MTASRRKQLETLLLAEREQVQQTLSRLQTAPDPQADVGRFADEASASSSGASPDDDRALSAHTLRELAVIDQALASLREDSEHFGICHTCGKPIPFERLRLVPGTRHCRIHAPQ